MHVISPAARIGAGGAVLLVGSLLVAESMDAAGQSSTATTSSGIAGIASCMAPRSLMMRGLRVSIRIEVLFVKVHVF
jgi:hypothetical protein